LFCWQGEAVVGVGLSFADQLLKWSNGVANEVDFWTGWIRSKGNEYPEDFEQRLSLDDPWRAGDEPVPEAHWSILDVGAGPLTRLNKTIDGQLLDITAVDPLAPYYDRALSDNGVTPPIRTQQAFAEDLTALFPENHFDLVSCQNALDHSIDPIRAIEEMISVAKVGGYVVLAHARNEAESESYIGLHQWNFDKIDEKFVIWNKQEKHVVDDLFGGSADIKTYRNGEHIRTVFRKKASSPKDMAARHRERLQDVLSASLDAVYRIRLEAKGQAPADKRPRGMKRFFGPR
jgi:SAM-dependent methyltransferase